MVHYLCSPQKELRYQSIQLDIREGEKFISPKNGKPCPQALLHVSEIIVRANCMEESLGTRLMNGEFTHTVYWYCVCIQWNRPLK